MSRPPETERERAERRRSTWEGGVTTLEEMEALDREWWLRLTPAERLGLVWDLSARGFGVNEASPGLRGAAGGVRAL